MEKYNPWAHNNGENYEKFGTTDPYIIMEMEEYAEKRIAENDDAQAKEIVKKQLPEIQEKARANALKQVRNEYRLSKGVKIHDSSPFISETITINGTELNRSHFIPDKVINDPVNEDVKLFFDDQNDRWVVSE